MEAAALIRGTVHRGRKYYQANERCPIHWELAALVQSSFGLAEPLRESCAGLATCAAALFAYRSFDDLPGKPPSIGLMLVLKKGAAPDGYLRQTLEQPLTWVFGGEELLGELAGG